MSQLHLAVGLDTSTGVAQLLDAAERLDGIADFMTIEDRFADPSGDGPDGTLVANFMAARTRRLGLVAGAPLPVLEPFHVSTAIATLDHVSEGRAGLLVQVPRGTDAIAARRAIGDLDGFPAPDERAFVRDALDALEAIQRLWDSWDDDAVIRDEASQRFIDADRLHYIRFETKAFGILGPSITPRPPQGQPVVAARFAPGDDPLLAAAADIVFLSGTVEEIEASVRRLGRSNGPRRLFADLAVPSSGERIAEIVTAGRDLADRLQLSGLRFVTGSGSLDTLVRHLSSVPSTDAARESHLRERLGLARPANRFAASLEAA